MNKSTIGPASISSSQIEGEIQKVSSLIETAQQLLADHKMVDLTALREKVETLCRTIEQVQPEDTERVIKAITGIGQNLDKLSVALTVQNKSVIAQSRGATGMHAAVAYGKKEKES